MKLMQELLFIKNIYLSESLIESKLFIHLEELFKKDNLSMFILIIKSMNLEE